MKCRVAECSALQTGTRVIRVRFQPKSKLFSEELRVLNETLIVFLNWIKFILIKIFFRDNWCIFYLLFAKFGGCLSRATACFVIVGVKFQLFLISMIFHKCVASLSDRFHRFQLIAYSAFGYGRWRLEIWMDFRFQ